MLLTYTPEGADPRTWDVSPNKMPLPEVKAVQRASGLKFGEWADALVSADVDLIHALVWAMLKRQVPTLTIEQVDFTMDQISLDLSPAEVAQARDALRAKKDRTPDEDEALAELEAMTADDEGDDPKASTD